MVGDDLAFIVAASMTVTSDLSRRTGPKHSSILQSPYVCKVRMVAVSPRRNADRH